MSIDFSLPFWAEVVALFFLAVWLVQFCIQVIVHRAPLRHARKEAALKVPFAEDQPGVSVIVYTHNQAEELLRNLPMILDNDYPEFEVIVVDDGSSDYTSDVLTQMQQRSEHFSHTSLSDNVRNVSRYKMSLMLGVKAAKYDIILMTEAQCMPVSQRWISSMVRQLVGKKEMVLGPALYEARTGILNRFYQWDLFQRMVDMMGLTLMTEPYGGWATNMAFRKSLFFANHNEALSGHLNIHPGHDDLFVKAIYRRGNVTVECSPESLLLSQQSPLRYAWKKDRLSRAFTRRFYLQHPKSVKHLDTMSRYAMLFSGWVLFGYTLSHSLWYVFGAVSALLFLHYLFLMLTPYQLSKRLGIHRYVFFPLFTELFMPFVDFWFRFLAAFNPEQFYVGRIGR